MNTTKIKLTTLAILGLALGGCASKNNLSGSTYVPPEEIIAVKGIIRFVEGYDRCRDQMVEETVAQFRAVAEAKCDGDKSCEEDIFRKLESGEFSFSKAMKGAGSGSAIGVIPLAAGSSTASWGNVTIAGALIGFLSNSREPSLKECTARQPRLYNEKNERIEFVCRGWTPPGKKKNPLDDSYSEAERAELLLGSAFEKTNINGKNDIVVVNTLKPGAFVVRPCSIMTEKDFELVQKHFPVKLSEPTLYVDKKEK